VHCPGCGAANENGARICNTCGQKLAFGIHAQQREQPGSSLAEFERLRAKGRSKKLGVASLVFGLLSVLPFGWFAGIPAIVLGALSLAKKRPGKGMAVTGLLMGALAPILSTLVFFALLPGVAGNRERARQVEVRKAMTMFQSAVEGYAADRGQYPEERDLSLAGGRAYAYFPGGDPAGTHNANDPVPGELPENPYTGVKYAYGEDLFYFPAQLEPGMNAVLSEDDDLCPYSGYEAPRGRPGTIVVFGHTDAGGKEPLVIEYGILGFGRDTDDPLKANGAAGEAPYFVLYGSLSAEAESDPEETDTLPD